MVGRAGREIKKITNSVHDEHNSKTHTIVKIYFLEKLCFYYGVDTCSLLANVGKMRKF